MVFLESAVFVTAAVIISMTLTCVGCGGLFMCFAWDFVPTVLGRVWKATRRISVCSFKVTMFCLAILLIIFMSVKTITLLYPVDPSSYAHVKQYAAAAAKTEGFSPAPPPSSQPTRTRDPPRVAQPGFAHQPTGTIHGEL